MDEVQDVTISFDAKIQTYSQKFESHTGKCLFQ